MDTDKKLEENIRNSIEMMMGEGMTFADTHGIRPQELEALYKLGLGFYQAGNFDKAETVFKFLVMIEHTSSKYLTALGAVYQVKKNFDKAVEAYGVAGFLDMHNPKPHYYAAECLLQKGDVDDAENAIISLLDCCPAGTAKNDKYRAKAEKLMAAIRLAKQKA